MSTWSHLDPHTADRLADEPPLPTADEWRRMQIDAAAWRAHQLETIVPMLCAWCSEPTGGPAPGGDCAALLRGSRIDLMPPAREDVRW